MDTRSGVLSVECSCYWDYADDQTLTTGTSAPGQSWLILPANPLKNIGYRQDNSNKWCVFSARQISTVTSQQEAYFKVTWVIVTDTIRLLRRFWVRIYLFIWERRKSWVMLLNKQVTKVGPAADVLELWWLVLWVAWTPVLSKFADQVLLAQLAAKSSTRMGIWPILMDLMELDLV